MIRLAITLTAAIVSTPAVAKDTRVVAEAREFMASYARDLLAADHQRLSGRYSRKGVYSLGMTPSALESHPSTVEYYRDKWTPPTKFSWTNLKYEPLDRDTVLVVGGFDMTVVQQQPVVTMAYTALLRREDGVLRIRLEHENLLEPPPK